MTRPLVTLFGYDSSTFTIKVRHVLQLKQIRYTFVPVPTMMPRPLLRDNFHLTYRKIPVLAIGRDIYCDSSLICEALEHFFPPSAGFRTLYPPAADGRNYRSMIRGFASYWTDRPLFRVACGLMPPSIWRSQFGVDRGQLIGHKLDPDKLEKKIPENLTKLDQQLSMLEPLFENGEPWIFSTGEPSLADVSLYYELLWASDVAAGKYTNHITEGEAKPEVNEGAMSVFNDMRYPALLAWYHRMQQYFERLPDVEDKKTPFASVLKQMSRATVLDDEPLLLPTPRSTIPELDAKVGLITGALVAVAPDDTGKDDPTIGTLVGLSPEEVVIEPKELEKPATINTRIHFPRLGFVVRPARTAHI